MVINNNMMTDGEQGRSCLVISYHSHQISQHSHQQEGDRDTWGLLGTPGGNQGHTRGYQGYQGTQGGLKGTPRGQQEHQDQAKEMETI